MNKSIAAVFLILAGALGTVPAVAQPAEEAAAEAGDRGEAFRAVEHGETEDVPGGPLLLGAYALVWLFVLAYMLRLARLQRSTENDLARLQQSVEKAAREQS